MSQYGAYGKSAITNLDTDISKTNLKLPKRVNISLARGYTAEQLDL